MNEELHELRQQVAGLQRQLKGIRRMSAACLMLLTVATAAAWRRGPRAQDPIRTRLLIIQDEQGRDRMFVGNIPDKRRQLGIAVQDSTGHERFGMGLKQNGAIGMGFDAPPGTGDDRNRERINMWADENGGAAIRFLDRTTRVKSLWYLDKDNRAWLEFSDRIGKEWVRKRIGFSGPETVKDTL
jgi:hypothetical protein